MLVPNNVQQLGRVARFLIPERELSSDVEGGPQMREYIRTELIALFGGYEEKDHIWILREGIVDTTTSHTEFTTALQSKKDINAFLEFSERLLRLLKCDHIFAEYGGSCYIIRESSSAAT